MAGTMLAADSAAVTHQPWRNAPGAALPWPALEPRSLRWIDIALAKR
jgi:hypothetical protein